MTHAQVWALLAILAVGLFSGVRLLYSRRDYGTSPRNPPLPPWIDKHGRLLRQVVRPVPRARRR